MDVAELERALGRVVLGAAYLERMLRTAFCALVGSKYAAVVAGHLTESALIDDCRLIASHHTDLPEPAKQAVLAALHACDAARKKRNRIMHDTWVIRPGDVVVTLQADQRSDDVTVTARTSGEVRQVADELAEAASRLKAAMTTAFGPGWVDVEDQLRRELGHDIGVDSDRT